MIEFGDLPEDIRVRLSEESEQKLWKRVEQRGIAEAAEQTGFSRENVYSWRSSDVFIPVSFIKEFLNEPELAKMKGGGRSKPAEIGLPIEENSELKTRVDLSVSINEDGVPFYQTSDRGNLNRLSELLQQLGEIPYTLYRRGNSELRFPKYIYSIIMQFDCENDFAAAFDEQGKLENGKMKAVGSEVPPRDFQGDLYSSKRLTVALERGDEEKVRKILQESASRADSLIG